MKIFGRMEDLGDRAFDFFGKLHSEKGEINEVRFFFKFNSYFIINMKAFK